MKITFLIDHTDVSGGARRMMTLCNLLVERGHDVTLVAGVGRAPKWFPLKARFLRCSHREIAGIPDADAIFFPSMGSPDLYASYPESKGKKFLLAFHFAVHDEAAEVRNIRGPFTKIVTTRWLEDKCRELDPAGGVYRIGFAIDKQFFTPVPRRAEGDAFTVGLVYHRYPWKGFADGVEAVRRVRARFPQTRLLVFGAKGAPEVGDLPCEFHPNPPQDRLRWLYAKCDAFVCPSWSEGLGSPSIEAMACRVAVVTTDNGGSRDFAVHERTALVSPPKDPAALAANITRLIEDPVLRHSLVDEGYRAITAMRWSDCADKLEAALADVTGLAVGATRQASGNPAHTGEFFIPGEANDRMEADHLERYRFAAHYAAGKRVLDIACGVGYGSHILAEAGAAAVQGVDIMPSNVAYAADRYSAGNLSFETGDLTAFTAREPFDLVTSFETIEHVPDYETALDHLAGALRPGGTLLISSPNRPITSPLARTLAQRPENPFHCREFTPEELSEALERRGLRVAKIFGQRLQRRFENRILRGLYNRLVRPSETKSPKVGPLDGMAPRYFVIEAVKA